MWAGTYILRGKIPVKASTLEWAKWMESGGNDARRVALDYIGRYRISTVFLGLDHSFGGPTAILFETMVFRGESYKDLEMERYASWEQAEEGHRRMVAKYHARTNRKRQTT